ncbi:MAG: polar amino acid transport system substrate-binding protein [Frankiaceae bacterium]|nr:polar amino acid transport system substrate-binding protein [Frankiaceae bacterium]
MTRTPRHVASAVALASALALAAACGGSSSGGNAKVTSGGTNAAAAAKVPASLKTAGVVKVATDASYAPNEFFAADNKTIQGMDVDLGQAIGAELGVKFTFSNVTFDSIIPALGNRYDLGIASFTDNKDREKVVDMVDYFSAGTSFMVPAGSSLAPKTVADLCGKTAAVEKGTTQLDDLTAQKKKCKLTILAFPDQNQANLALQSGRADVVMADSPVNAYAAKQSAGKFIIAGSIYGTAPYGIAVPKDAAHAGLADAISLALQDLAATGKYQTILKKWGVQAGAVTSFGLNGAVS